MTEIQIINFIENYSFLIWASFGVIPLLISFYYECGEMNIRMLLMGIIIGSIIGPIALMILFILFVIDVELNFKTPKWLIKILDKKII